MMHVSEIVSEDKLYFSENKRIQINLLQEEHACMPLS